MARTRRCDNQDQNATHFEETKSLQRRVKELEQELLHRNQVERASFTNLSDFSDSKNPFYFQRAKNAPTFEERLANTLENLDRDSQENIASFQGHLGSNHFGD